MEPRLRSRGSSAIRGCYDRQRSFNGAAAAKPRKPVSDGVPHAVALVLQWSRGCEAAEARLGRGAPCGRARPSMEPRLRSRGSRPWTHHNHELVTCLQWSRGCEAAEARYWLRYREASAPFNGAAAAKPRKLEPAAPVVKATPPSMEPRLRSRGSASGPAVLSSPASLQWSRGCEAAEASEGGVDVELDTDLQWSRGCEAAEA